MKIIEIIRFIQWIYLIAIIILIYLLTLFFKKIGSGTNKNDAVPYRYLLSENWGEEVHRGIGAEYPNAG